MTFDPVHALSVARGRHLAYSTLGRLVLRGLDEATAPLVRDLPGLSEALPEELDLDDLAAEHHALFGLESMPYAAEFEPSRADGTRAVLDSFRAGGFVPRIDDARADHLGILLGHLAFLCGAHGDAIEDGATLARRRTVEVTATFIDRHLLSWLPCYLAGALHRAPSLWTAVLEMTWDVLTEHRASLPVAAATRSGPPGRSLRLEDDATSLRDVAAYLSEPARCGVFLSRGDITAVARGAGTPRGFGSRRMMIENLLHTAAEYGQSPGVASRLRALVARRRDAMLDLSAARVDTSSLAPWLRRIDDTTAILAAIESAAATPHAAAGSPPELEAT